MVSAVAERELSLDVSEGTSIPKVLHYIWIGGAPLPKAFQDNIDQWQRLMPDYRIVRWDERNFDVHGHPWMRKMYAERGFAFASDYMRLKILHEHGGIYLDTDTWLKKRLDPFLDDHLIVPFEFDCHLSTGVIAARKGHPFLLEWMAPVRPPGRGPREQRCDHAVLHRSFSGVPPEQQGSGGGRQHPRAAQGVLHRALLRCQQEFRREPVRQLLEPVHEEQLVEQGGPRRVRRCDLLQVAQREDGLEE
jgi:hypothetical protein